MSAVLSITLATGAQQLAKHKAIVIHITAIKELAGVTVLCSDNTGTLTTKSIDRATIHTYGLFSADDVMLHAYYVSRTENRDVINTSVVALSVILLVPCWDPRLQAHGNQVVQQVLPRYVLTDFTPPTMLTAPAVISHRREARHPTPTPTSHPNTPPPPLSSHRWDTYHAPL
jgi:magnesium-transporting ATPase (P-type)